MRKGEEVEQQGRISALLASGLASWRGGETLESSSTLEQVCFVVQEGQVVQVVQVGKLVQVGQVG